MYSYEVIVRYSREDEAYIAEVPELPGCKAAGQTRYEALQNIEVVMAEWLETAKIQRRTIPQPQEKRSTRVETPSDNANTEPIFHSDLTMEQIEKNFEGVDLFAGLIAGLHEACAIEEGTAAPARQDQRSNDE